MENHTMPSILITGCAGYVGSALLPHVLKQGYRVRGVDNLLYDDDGLKKIYSEFEFIEGDLRNSHVRRAALKGIETVIHLAAISTDPAGKSLARLTVETNMEMTESLGREAKEAGVKKFIYASTGSVYHAVPPLKDIVSEDIPLNPQSAYSLSKYVSEEKLLDLADNDFMVIIFRKATLYGQSPRMRYDIEANTYTREAVTKGIFTIYDKEIKRPFADIQDACAMYMKAIDAPHNPTLTGKYNIVTQNYVMSELAQNIAQIAGESLHKNIQINTTTPTSYRAYWMDNAKSIRMFSYSPVRTFKEAIQEMIDGVRAIENPYDEKFDNYAYLVKRGKI